VVDEAASVIVRLDQLVEMRGAAMRRVEAQGVDTLECLSVSYKATARRSRASGSKKLPVTAVA
jgi:hypothetical protein